MEEITNREFYRKIRKEIKIVDYLAKLGYSITKAGKYYSTKEHDSLRIDDDKNVFYRNSTGDRGSIIDFLVKVEGYSLQNAVNELKNSLETVKTVDRNKIEALSGVQKSNENSGKFVLPTRNYASNDKVIDYLLSRRIDYDIIKEMIASKRIYQAYKYNSAVFVSCNDEGVPDFACIRGTSTKKRFAADVPNSNYDNCFYLNNFSNTVIATESVIDALSYMTYLKRNGLPYNSVNYLAISGCGKLQALYNRVMNDTKIKNICFAFDNDKAGIKAKDRAVMKLAELGWQGRCYSAFPLSKDWNDEICVAENLNYRRPERILLSLEKGNTATQNPPTQDKPRAALPKEQTVVRI